MPGRLPTPDERAKATLRRELRAARRGLAPGEQARRADLVRRAALAAPTLRKAAAVVGYLACDGELDITPLLAGFGAQGIRTLVPRVCPERHLDLVDWTPETNTRASGPGGVQEPVGPAVGPGALPSATLLLCPCVGASPSGSRLGRGGGYYDVLIPRAMDAGWTVIAVCHSDAIRPNLPTEAHDAPVAGLLSDRGWEPVP